MKRLLLILIVLLISIWLGAGIAADPGYVLVAYKKWTMELPLWFAFVLLLVLFELLYGLARLWRNLRSLPKRLYGRSLQRQNRNAQNLTKQGLLLLAADKPVAAEKKLLRGLAHNSMPWVNYLAVAYIANANNDLAKANDYLQKASEITPEAQVAISLAQAHFCFEQQQWDQALATLKHLHLLMPKHTYVLSLLARVYLQLKDWRGLLDLLPTLRKYKVFSLEKITDLEIQTYHGLLFKASHENDLSALQRIWQSLPRTLCENPRLVSCYAKFLIANHVDDEAEKLLSKTLSKVWDDKLAYLYGFVKSVKPDRQLMNAEGWLKSHPNNAVLLLSAGRLCMYNQLWGKARSYFEASVVCDPQPGAYQELAKLLEQLGEQAAAKDCYIRGLELALR